MPRPAVERRAGQVVGRGHFADRDLLRCVREVVEPDLPAVGRVAELPPGVSHAARQRRVAGAGGQLRRIVYAPALGGVVVVLLEGVVRPGHPGLGEAHELAVVEVGVVVVRLAPPVEALVAVRAGPGRIAGQPVAVAGVAGHPVARVVLGGHHHVAPALVVGPSARVRADAIAAQRVEDVGGPAVGVVAGVLPGEGLLQPHPVVDALEVVAVALVALAPEPAQGAAGRTAVAARGRLIDVVLVVLVELAVGKAARRHRQWSSGRGIAAHLQQLSQFQPAGGRLLLAGGRVRDGDRPALVVAELVLAQGVPGGAGAGSDLDAGGVEEQGALNGRAGQPAAGGEIDRVVAAQAAVGRAGRAAVGCRVPGHELDPHQGRPAGAGAGCLRVEASGRVPLHGREHRVPRIGHGRRLVGLQVLLVADVDLVALGIGDQVQRPAGQVLLA